MSGRHTVLAIRPVRLLLPALLFAVLTVLVLVPFGTLLYASFASGLPFAGEHDIGFTLANYAALWSPALGRAIVNTMIVSLAGAAIAMVFGCSMAWFAARTDIPCRGLVQMAGVMPLFVSLLVAAISWSLLGAGRTGYINIVLGSLGVPLRINMQSLGGIAVVNGLYYAPYPYLFLYSALTLIHPDLEEAAAVHGGDVPRILRHLTFPLVKPAFLGSLLLIIVLMAEEFPVPQILGAPVGIETLSIRIYKLISRVPSLPNQASAVSILLTALVCLLVFAQHRILRGRDYRTVTGKGAQQRLVPLGRMRWAALAFVAVYAFVAIILPLFALMQGALRNSFYIPNAAALFNMSQFSLRHITDALASPAVHLGLENSLLAGLSAAVLGSVFFFVLAYVIQRTDLPGHRSLEYLVMMPVAVPALVMGIGILWTWVSLPLPVYGTLAILVIGFVTRFMPQGYRAVSSSIAQIHDDLEHAALVAGATRWQAVRLIILPLARGGVATSFFLMIVLGMRELTASIFLYTTDTRLLSIVIYDAYESGMWSSVASISLVYTLVLVILTVISRRWMRPRL